MRYLKKKVFLYPPERTTSRNTVQDQNACPNKPEPLPQKEEVKQIPLLSPPHSERSRASQDTSASTFELEVENQRRSPKTNSKTVVKNFGKAMCAFASSELALPYFNQLFEVRDDVRRAFQLYIKKKKGTVDSIESLRSLLLVSKDDSAQLALYKNFFRELSIIFIKYFSVNWIFQGKMAHKDAHLRARFKMLRRVQHPEYFTYFKGFVKESEAKHH